MSRFVPQDEGPRTQPWLNSYADLVTLLWTFFILLFSLSVVSTQRFQAALRSYFEAVGMPRDITDVLPGTPGSIVPGHMTNIVDPIQALMAMELEDLEKTGEELRQRLIEAGLVESARGPGSASVRQDQHRDPGCDRNPGHGRDRSGVDRHDGHPTAGCRRGSGIDSGPAGSDARGRRRPRTGRQW